MSNDAKDALGYGGGFLAVVIGIVIAVWFAGVVIGAIGNWWGGVVKSWQPTPEQVAERERQEKEWENDPTNPYNIKKKCLEEGGYPEYHFWKGGDVTCERSKANES